MPLTQADYKEIADTFVLQNRIAAINLARTKFNMSITDTLELLKNVVQGGSEKNSDFVNSESQSIDFESFVDNASLISEKVFKVQEVVANNISKKTTCGKVVSNIFEIVKNYSKTECEFALGTLGKSLYQFMDKADMTHPSIADIQNGELTTEHKSYNQISEALLFGKFAQEQKAHEIPDLVKKWFNESTSTYSRIQKIFVEAASEIVKKRRYASQNA